MGRYVATYWYRSHSTFPYHADPDGMQSYASMYWLGVVRILRHLKIDIPQPTRCYTPTGVLYSLKVKFNYCCPDKCLNMSSFDKCETPEIILCNKCIAP